MTTSPELPAAATDYFERMDGDRSTTLDLFTPDARVEDDGHTYLGREEIRGWLSGAASEWTTTSTRLSAEPTDDGALVVIRLEGDFPGGVVVLRHVFAIDAGGYISALSIAP